MNNKVTLVIVVCIIAGFLFFSRDAFVPSTETPASTEAQNVEANEETIEENEAFDRLAYLPFNQTNFDLAKENGDVVLFFAATQWCTTCEELEKEIEANLIRVPDNVTILKVDFDRDKDKDSVAQYKVTRQHTLVVLDSSETEFNRWIGGNFDYLITQLEDK